MTDEQILNILFHDGYHDAAKRMEQLLEHEQMLDMLVMIMEETLADL